MTSKFTLTQSAIKDIEEIADYISQQSNFSCAEKFLSDLDAKMARIAKFPNLGKTRDEISQGIRSFPIDHYLILYLPVSDGVEILRVMSGYRDLSTLFDA